MTIEVDYRFPAGADAAKEAKVIAVGQTAGSWDERFSHRAELLAQHLGRVVCVTPQPDGTSIATVEFPEHNVEGDVPTLLTMIFGKYSMGGSGRVDAVRLPEDYGTPPKFGLAGIRRILGVPERPLVMAIFKPALGLSAEDHAAILREVAFAGLDIIKDDEILGDLPSAPTMERLRACRRVLDEVEKSTGRRVLYCTNLTGRGHELSEKARAMVAAGANALLLNVLSYGYGTAEALARDPQVGVPIFAHPALAGAFAASPDFGISYPVVLGTLMAHAGVDAVLYPAHYGSLPFTAANEFAIRDALRARGLACVPSAGIHPGVVPRVLGDYGNDVVLNAGSGIMDHPDGAAAGVQAFFDALAVAKPGVPFTQVDVPPTGPLRSAMLKWGLGKK